VFFSHPKGGNPPSGDRYLRLAGQGRGKKCSPLATGRELREGFNNDENCLPQKRGRGDNSPLGSKKPVFLTHYA